MSVPIITPAGPLTKRGKELTHFTADQTVTWTTDGGVLSGITTTATDWTAPNQTGVFHVNGINGSLDTGIVVISVDSVIPNYWEYQNPIEAIKKVLEFVPVYGPTQHRTFGSPVAQHKWELGADDSSYEEYLEMKAFWDYHHPGKSFLMLDPILNQARRYETDSDWSSLYKPGDSYSWKFKIKEVWPYSLIT